MKHHTNMGSVYYQTAQNIKSNGIVIDAGSGGKAIEVINQQIGLSTPYHLGISEPTRKWSKEYAIAEFLWYLGMNRRVGCMGQFAQIWDNIKDKDGLVESNYGYYLFNNNWYWIINELETDPESRRAVISIYNNSHKANNKLDHPCSMYVQFLVRDYKLHMIWNMRSCDLIYGLCNDMFCAALILQLMNNEMKHDYLIELGSVTFNIGSLHVYEKHWPMIFKAKPSYVRGNSYELSDELVQTQIRSDEFAIYGYNTKEQCYAKINKFNKTHIKGYL